MTTKNRKGLGKYQQAMYLFALRWQGWHQIDPNDGGYTMRIARSLERRGLIKINQFRQFIAA